MKAIVAASAVLIIIALISLTVARRKRGNVLVLGEEIARAAAAEEGRKARGDSGKSPMPSGKYDLWRGEQSLIDPVPIALDSALTDLVQRFSTSDAMTRATMRASISMEEFYTLLAYSRRAAVFAMRNHSREWLENGLTAIAMIDAERVDYRDILLSLSLLYHSAFRMSANADGLFRSASALSEGKVSRFLNEFIEGSQQQRDLRTSWGYDEVDTEHGVGFIGWGFKAYDPTYDLKKFAVDLGEFISTGKYQVGSIQVAEEFPKVWLGSEKDAALARTLKSVRACASIHAALRPAEYPDYKSQTLMAFIVEVDNQQAVQELLSFSTQRSPSNYGMIGLAEGRLFCLLVGRSYMVGVKSFETSQSMARFSEGVAQIMRRYVTEHRG